ncbi:MAG: hypothetical protein RL226_1494 [Bacteroidota bacterium]
MLTTGTFDGVHLGHREIINRLRDIADRVGGETVLMTFYPHPRLVLFPDDPNIQLLQTIEEKKASLKEAGIDHLILLPFTQEFAKLSALEYVRDVLVQTIGVHTVVVGYDHRFGKNREGDFSSLEEFSEMFGFHVEEIPARLIDDLSISSTKIRNALLAGAVDQANSYLGYNYLLSGCVIHGDGLGHKLGFPTANLRINDSHKLIPGPGVYAVHVKIKGSNYNGMMNIGVRPTVSSSDEKRLEVHLFDFSDDLYGAEMEVRFAGRIRNEMKFNSVDELKAQLLVDKQHAVEMTL